ncbi:carbon-nitrogen hydrolase family protein [Candidatus Poribacteria bacterium]|nr:carbon-nitrogen hydrolase family protein [Candidatus Poribacteria bacterium]
MEKDDTIFTVAVAQATPVFLNREATVEKACNLISEAGRMEARLIVFPEAFIPAYPDWVWTIPPSNKLLNDLYIELINNAVTIPDHATERLCQAAKAAGIYVAIGINERNAESSNTSLYNTMLYINSEGSIIGKHRKIIPTGGERLVWARGDGSTMDVYDTPFGKLGGLTCWENYMPLARYAMYSWGTQIYVAATWDSGEPWLSTLRHIAKEGCMFVIGCCMVMKIDDIPDSYEFRKFYRKDKEWINVGGSSIVNPNGQFLAEPLEREEGILYAEIDLKSISGSKWILDVAGNYARPDIFRFSINRRPNVIMQIDGHVVDSVLDEEECPQA